MVTPINPGCSLLFILPRVRPESTEPGPPLGRTVLPLMALVIPCSAMAKTGLISRTI